jgi:dTDP-4-amino-4,6-dideoxygalactose transaminase
MEALRQSRAWASASAAHPASARFIPALPTLWPQMLLRSPRAAPPFPFEAPGVRFYYFGRNAVWTMARVLRLDQGEVLVPAYHHGVEIEALADAGAALRFFPVGPRMQVDPEDVARLIGPRTRAIYFIHYLGFPGPAQALRELASSHGLALIEDCALSLLSRDGDRPLGTWGDAAIYSIYKTLPVPNGGLLLMSEYGPQGLPQPSEPPVLSTFSHLASSLLQNLELRGGSVGRLLRQAARGLGRLTVETTGIERVATGTQHFNRAHADLGMSALTRRIALSQDFAGIVERRRRNYFFLLSHLRDVAPPLFTELPPGVCPLFYPLKVEDKAGLQARLAARGIETVDFWRYGHPACPPGGFPDVDTLRRTVLEVPIHQDLSPAMMGALADAVHRAVRK